MNRDRPFEGVLGNSVELRLIEHLISMPKMDFNITELTRLTGVSRASTNMAAKKFLEWGIIKNVGKRGNMTLYKIDLESPIVVSVSRFNNSLMHKMHPDLYEGENAQFQSDP
ncbi:MAG: hypothetical protein WC375_03505 [Methanomassiliicoccales archaeon]|jgi:DNA-binding IclR family transcriptional regulator